MSEMSEDHLFCHLLVRERGCNDYSPAWPSEPSVAGKALGGNAHA